jgi:hypothetical protein
MIKSLAITKMNSVPYTLKAQVLAEVKVPDIVQQVLRNDMAKVLDSAVATEFKKSYIKAACETTASTVFSTDSTSAAGTDAGANMSDKNVRDIIDYMKRLNIPRYDGNNYVSIASTLSIRGLYDYFESKIQYTDARPMFKGEIGTYYGLN